MSDFDIVIEPLLTWGGKIIPNRKLVNIINEKNDLIFGSFFSLSKNTWKMDEEDMAITIEETYPRYGPVQVGYKSLYMKGKRIKESHNMCSELMDITYKNWPVAEWEKFTPLNVSGFPDLENSYYNFSARSYKAGNEILFTLNNEEFNSLLVQLEIMPDYLNNLNSIKSNNNYKQSLEKDLNF